MTLQYMLVLAYLEWNTEMSFLSLLIAVKSLSKVRL
jgi:hypothetical protein